MTSARAHHGGRNREHRARRHERRTEVTPKTPARRQQNTEKMETMNNPMQTSHPEYQYLDLLLELLTQGDKRMDRTGVGTQALFGREMRFDLTESFPILTTKRVYWRTAFKEILWLLGSSIVSGASSRH